MAHYKRGAIVPAREDTDGNINGPVKYWRKADLDNLKLQLNASKGHKKAGNAKVQAGKDFHAALASVKAAKAMPIDEGFEDEDGGSQLPAVYETNALAASEQQLFQMLALPENPTTKQIVGAMQRRVAGLVLRHSVLEILVADLLNPDWKARQAAAEKLLSMVMPKVRSTEVVHTESEDKVRRQEQALRILEDIKLQRDLLTAPHQSVRVIEIDAIEVRP